MNRPNVNDDIAVSLPVITLSGELAKNATDGERALLAAGVDIYENCGKLVRPVVGSVTAVGGRKTHVAQLEDVSAVYLRDLLSRHAVWQNYVTREKKMVPRDPPMDVAKTILARVGEWSFKTVNGVISAPTMRPDGSLITEPGYDEDTGLILFKPPPMPYISPEPSFTDAKQALAFLEDLLFEFPFTNDYSKAVALSALITPIARGGFECAPMHAVNATAAGSGKSYLADLAAAIAIGDAMPVITASKSIEETEKRLGASLLAGQSLVSIDNITTELGGDALCQVVERPNALIRILGRSKLARVKTRGTTFFATGNCLTVRGDMTRRLITASIDTKVERPEQRSFEADPFAKIMADRGKYIAAALVICRAYMVAGRPKLAKRLASFEGWSDCVRSALIWLGQCDPLETMEAQRDLDPERIELAAMLSAWASAIGVGPDTRSLLSDVIKKGKEDTELATAIQMVAGQKADATLLGKWMRGKKGRVIGGYRFDNFTNKKEVTKWWVVEAGGKQGGRGGASTTQI
jgi:putative DNA primase/helicase